MNPLIERLRKVKRTGDGRYVACCPAHNDKTPSMTIREMPDGRILFHCFSGCEPEAILDAIGLKFSDVMPECKGEFKRERSPYSSRDILACVAYEAFVASAIAADGGKDRERLITAASRIKAGLDMADGL